MEIVTVRVRRRGSEGRGLDLAELGREIAKLSRVAAADCELRAEAHARSRENVGRRGVCDAEEWGGPSCSY